jgi:hypothetical protein
VCLWLQSYLDSHNTLKYANRAKAIAVKPTATAELTDIILEAQRGSKRQQEQAEVRACIELYCADCTCHPLPLMPIFIRASVNLSLMVRVNVAPLTKLATYVGSRSACCCRRCCRC